MAQWYVKDLGKLTQVSVQTLHHYDRLGLLKPSVRLPNGYRLYSEKDLMKLQQILALKFFGFELAQIKILLGEEVDVLDHFTVQARFLEEKAKALLEASQTLNRIVSGCRRSKSIPWETIIQLIEVYRMTQELEKSWVGKVMTPEELKEYAKFEQGLKTRFTENEKHSYEERWAALVREVEASIDLDPASETGRDLGRRCMEWVNSLYGKQFVKLRTTIWEKGFKQGHGAQEHGMSPNCVAWMDKAIDAYYRHRIHGILEQVGTQPQSVVLKAWNEVLMDMYGDQEIPKKELIQLILKDEKISPAARHWLKEQV